MKRRQAQLLALILGVVFLALLHRLVAADLECPLGEPLSAGLGDGVVLHSCNWEKTPGHLVRTGPLQLVKNGVLILQLTSDREGRLHGEYTVWNDQGNITISGQYREGLKEGEWRITDERGNTRVITYSAGITSSP